MTYFEALKVLEKIPENTEALQIISRDKKMILSLLDNVFQTKQENKDWTEKRRK